ncbi:lysophosphatidic acid receptor 6-like [Varanus komodoensis]|uniref:lysophosphatidic acid receptor 6-like n=1 Tax=Varanus komodoensis TaxID=61221 RepID=UPI001CF77351|nr:lysophosphatidic acid receptor 6-like [Varanus komodoensis]
MENQTLAGTWLNWTAANTSAQCLPQADFQYSLFTVVYSAVFVLGLFENGVVLYLLTCRAKNPPRPNIYLVNLAVVDALFACVLPFKIHYHQSRNDWTFGDVACRITGSVYFLNIYLSIAFFTCLCIDRYVAVLHPFVYIRIQNFHYGIVALVLWVTALATAGPLVLGGPLSSRQGNKTVCFESFTTSNWTGRMMPYNTCALIFGFVVPFVVILVSYPLIARRISRIPRSARKRKALGTIYLILFICVTCFLPYHVTHLLHFLTRAGLIQDCRFATFIYRMRRFTLALISLNCCLNPILYYFTLAINWQHWRLRLRARTTTVYTISGARDGKSQAPKKPMPWRRERSNRAADGVNLMRLPTDSPLTPTAE